MRVENASLFKQLTEITQKLNSALVDNRVLKSDVEALRAKVRVVLARLCFTRKLTFVESSSLKVTEIDLVRPLLIPLAGEDGRGYGSTVSSCFRYLLYLGY